MKKVRLNENDIERLVNKIIKEEQLELEFGDEGYTQDEMNKVWRGLNELGPDFDDMMEDTFNNERMSVESFVDRLPTHYLGGTDYEHDYLVSILKQIQDEGI